ncbi:MAG TPA: hypothetical protein VF120_03235 [Ktedonobacterales bacterium]
MEDAVQRFADRGEFAQANRQASVEARPTLRSRKTAARRAARARGEVSSERDLAIAEAVRRLEREHVALILALCELDDLSETPAMRQALQLLLREDLSRTQHALNLASQDRYGKCEECARPLPRRTLELRPATTRCSFCATDLDSH